MHPLPSLLSLSFFSLSHRAKNPISNKSPVFAWRWRDFEPRALYCAWQASRILREKNADYGWAPGLLFEREIERAERDLIDGRIFHGYEGNRIVSVSTTVQTTLPFGWYVALSELRYYTRFIVPTTVPSSSPLAYYLYMWASVCVSRSS